MHQAAALASIELKSRVNGAVGSAQRALLRVLKRRRSVPLGTWASSSHFPETWPPPLNSSTRHGPTSDAMGRRSTVLPPSLKWIGGSTCVPVGSPKVTSDTFAESPF